MQISADVGEYPLSHRFERKPGFPYWTCALITAGSARSYSGRHDVTKVAPCIGLMHPNTPYTVCHGGVGKTWCEYYSIFTPPESWRPLLAWPTAWPGMAMLTIPDDPSLEQIEGAFKQVIQSSHCAIHVREELMRNALHRVFLLAAQWVSLPDHGPHDPRVREAVAYLDEHLAEPIDVATLAEQVHLSPSHLAHLFTQDMNESPMQMLERLRLSRAQDLLLGTNQSISDIAEQVGYPNAFHFSARFKRRFGISPRQYRNQPMDSLQKS